MGLKFYSKPRRKRIGPEASLQMAVVQHLMLRAPKGAIWFSVPNEGKRSPAIGAHLKRMGMLPGVADLVICLPGDTPSFLELKAKGERQSDDQIAFQDLCRRNGSRYEVADNIDDALAVLRRWGAVRELYHQRRQQSAADEARRAGL